MGLAKSLFFSVNLLLVSVIDLHQDKTLHTHATII